MKPIYEQNNPNERFHMCLYYDSKTVNNDNKKMFSNRKTALLWKIFAVHKTQTSKTTKWTLSSPYRMTPVSTQNSYFVSNRTLITTNKTETKNNEINRGVHVWKKSPPKVLLHDGVIVLRVVCNKDDLVANNAKHAVFMKIKLLDKDIKKYNTEIKTPAKKEKKHVSH